MKNLYKKLYDMMCETRAIEKDLSVAGQYKAISESVVLNEIKPLLKKYRLIVMPVGVDVQQEGKLTVLAVTWRIVDVDTGESADLMSPGNGADTQDKGSGKAWTYAYKALFQKLFMLFSGEDTDLEHSEVLSAKIKEDDEVITKSEADVLESLINQSSRSGETMAWIKRRYKVSDLINLKPSQYVEVLAKINKAKR